MAFTKISKRTAKYAVFALLAAIGVVILKDGPNAMIIALFLVVCMAVLIVLIVFVPNIWKKPLKEIPKGTPVHYQNRSGEPFHEEDLPVTKLVKRKPEPDINPN